VVAISTMASFHGLGILGIICLGKPQREESSVGNLLGKRIYLCLNMLSTQKR
jgi:hypothetical protein